MMQPLHYRFLAQLQRLTLWHPVPEFLSSLLKHNTHHTLQVTHDTPHITPCNSYIIQHITPCTSHIIQHKKINTNLQLLDFNAATAVLIQPLHLNEFDTPQTNSNTREYFTGTFT